MMRNAAIGALVLAVACLGAARLSPAEDDPRPKAAALWEAREDLGTAERAIEAYQAILQKRADDGEALLRLSRLHYWIGQNLESASREKALAHYGKGREYGQSAAKAAPDDPGGYFFEAANLARENNLKGTFSNLFGIGTVRKLNEKAASLSPDYFYGGPDRFFCAYYTKLPGLFGGDRDKAIEHGRRAVESFPDYAGNRYFLAEAYRKAGMTDLARKELAAAAALPDDAHPDAVPEQRMEKRRAAALRAELER